MLYNYNYDVSHVTLDIKQCFNRCETSRDAINPDLTYLFDKKATLRSIDYILIDFLK